MTHNCPTCGCLLNLPEEYLGRQVICPKCRAKFAAPASPASHVPPASEAIELPSQDDPFPQRTMDDDAHYLTEHPKSRSRFSDIEEDDYPPEQFLARGLPGGRRAIAVIIFLCLSIVVDAAMLGVNSLQYGIIHDALRGIPPNHDQAVLYDSLEGVLGVLEFLLYLVTAVLFRVWTYRAYKNLRRLGVRGLKHSPGWAVGWFFIPIANLFKPCVVFLEMWRASDPQAPIDDAYAWQRQSGGALIGFWWASWIVSNLISNASFRANLASNNPTLEHLKLLTALSGLAHVGSIIAAILAIFVVKAIQHREKETYRRLGESESGPQALW